MLQAHSLLWHYLWVAPNLLLLLLAFLLWRKQLQRNFPVFLLFAVASATVQLTVYAVDVIPSVTGETFWRFFWAGLLVEALLKFAVIGEIFGSVFGQFPSLAKLGTSLIRGVGVVLVLLAVAAAVYTRKDSVFWIISGAHLLEQAIYIVESGLIFFLFIFGAYFNLSWSRASFGITLGLGVSACVHLATWALAANGNLSPRGRTLIDFTNMVTYHVVVLIWFYYLLVPEKKISKKKKSPKSEDPPKPDDPPPPEYDLEVLNEELERLLHQ
jgi:hypothetical protein